MFLFLLVPPYSVGQPGLPDLSVRVESRLTAFQDSAAPPPTALVIRWVCLPPCKVSELALKLFHLFSETSNLSLSVSASCSHLRSLGPNVRLAAPAPVPLPSSLSQ